MVHYPIPSVFDPLGVLWPEGVQRSPDGLDGPVIAGVISGLAGARPGPNLVFPSPPPPLLAQGKEDEDDAEDEEDDGQEDARDDPNLLGQGSVQGQDQLVDLKNEICGSFSG